MRVRCGACRQNVTISRPGRFFMPQLWGDEPSERAGSRPGWHAARRSPGRSGAGISRRSTARTSACAPSPARGSLSADHLRTVLVQFHRGRRPNRHLSQLSGGGSCPGILLMETGVSLVDPRLSSRRLTEVVVRAEQLGYHAAWTNESVAREAFSTLAAWAAATTRIRLATGVLPVYVRSPMAAAMGAASIAAAAGPARMVLGIGAGHPVMARRYFGFDLSSPLQAVSDYLKIVSGLRHGARMTHHGPVFSVEGARLGLMPAGPLWTVVGAMGPRMLETGRPGGRRGVAQLVHRIPPAIHFRMAARIRAGIVLFPPRRLRAGGGLLGSGCGSPGPRRRAGSVSAAAGLSEAHCPARTRPGRRSGRGGLSGNRRDAARVPRSSSLLWRLRTRRTGDTPGSGGGGGYRGGGGGHGPRLQIEPQEPNRPGHQDGHTHHCGGNNQIPGGHPADDMTEEDKIRVMTYCDFVR